MIPIYNTFRKSLPFIPGSWNLSIKKILISIFYPVSKFVYNLFIFTNDTHHPISVMSYAETIECMRFNSLIRFGDGEFTLIGGGDIVYQQHSDELEGRLREILKLNKNGLLISIPDIFSDLSSYDTYSKKFWSVYRTVNYSFLQKILSPSSIYKYGNANTTRPYMCLNPSLRYCAEDYYGDIKKVWDSKDIVVIEGAFTRNGVGNNLFNNCNSVQRIICPSHNAYSYYSKILHAALKLDSQKLILISLGPAGKVLAYDLWEKGYHVLDVGHIDSDYEWFIHNATERISYNNNKHTAECDDDSIVDCKDSDYLAQIIDRIE